MQIQDLLKCTMAIAARWVISPLIRPSATFSRRGRRASYQHARSKGRRAFYLLAALLIPQYLLALPSDAQSKMYISAQNAQVDKLTGDSIYEGDVKIDRGTTHVTADKLTVKSVSGKVVLLTAFGHDQQLAHYQTKTDINKPVLDAYADIIKYYPPQHVVELIGHAYVIQGNSQVKGPHLEYDLNKQVLVTTSDPKNPTQKTTFIIDPSELQSNEKKS